MDRKPDQQPRVVDQFRQTKYSSADAENERHRSTSGVKRGSSEIDRYPSKRMRTSRSALAEVGNVLPTAAGATRRTTVPQNVPRNAAPVLMQQRQPSQQYHRRHLAPSAAPVRASALVPSASATSAASVGLASINSPPTSTAMAMQRLALGHQHQGNDSRSSSRNSNISSGSSGQCVPSSQALSQDLSIASQDIAAITSSQSSCKREYVPAPVATTRASAPPSVHLQQQQPLPAVSAPHTAAPTQSTSITLVEVPSDTAVPVRDIDEQDDGDLLMCAEYAEDIHNSMVAAEKRFYPIPMYLRTQPDLTHHMRGVLVDWLVDVAIEYRLKSATLYTAIALIDRFLCRASIVRGELQLVGIAAMLISAKYEEIYAPAVDDFAYISQCTYSVERICSMERTMLDRLGFGITMPTALDFLRRFVKAALSQGEPAQALGMLTSYYLEVSMMHYSMVTAYLPSHLAAAAVALGRHAVGCPIVWTATLRLHTGYTLADLTQCMRDMLGHVIASPGSLYRAVHEKYSHSPYLRVSRYPVPVSVPVPPQGSE